MFAKQLSFTYIVTTQKIMTLTVAAVGVAGAVIAVVADV